MLKTQLKQSFSKLHSGESASRFVQRALLQYTNSALSLYCSSLSFFCLSILLCFFCFAACLTYPQLSLHHIARVDKVVHSDDQLVAFTQCRLCVVLAHTAIEQLINDSTHTVSWVRLLRNYCHVKHDPFEPCKDILIIKCLSVYNVAALKFLECIFSV